MTKNQNLRDAVLGQLRSYGRRRRWRQIVTCLAAVVVFCTVYELILPAITAETATFSDREAVNESILEQATESVELTGDTAANVVSVAETQLGYTESVKDTVETPDGGENGYTHYGDEYGDPYGDWDAHFCAYVMDAAGIEDFPTGSSSREWAENLQADSDAAFSEADGYMPKPGDLIFIHEDTAAETVPDAAPAEQAEDADSVEYDTPDAAPDDPVESAEIPDTDTPDEGPSDTADIAPGENPWQAAEDTPDINHMGIVVDVVEGDGTRPAQIITIEGDSEDQVQYGSYEITDPGIQGYGQLPEGESFSLTAEAENGLQITLSGDTAGLPCPSRELTLAVSFPEGGEAEEILARQLEEEGIVCTDMVLPDIRLLHEGVEIEPAGYVTLTFADAARKSAPAAVYRIEQGAAVAVEADCGNGMMCVDTDHFGVFALLYDVELCSQPGVVPFMMEGAVLSAVSAPDYIGTYPTGPGSTLWQITKEEYAGNSHSSKIGVDSDGDGENDVYLQKNAVPTGTENEFLVYLSVDTKATWEDFLNDSRVGITTSNSYKNDPIGTVHSSIHGNVTAELYEHDYSGSTNRYYIRFDVYQNHSSSTPLYQYYDWRYGKTSNCSNATAFLTVAGLGSIVIAQEVNLHTEDNGTGNPFVLSVYLDSLSSDLAFYNTKLRSVTDILGDNIEYLGFVACDGEISYDEAGHTIMWYPEDNSEVDPNLSFNPVTGWHENVIQMVYRVRLNVEAEGFVSCADTVSLSKAASVAAGESFRVNESAVLSYDKIALPDTNGIQSKYGLSAAFPVPEVRGLLYDITFIKLNEEGRQLAGGVFALYQADGTTPVYGADGNPMLLTTDSSAVSRFADLPFGTYVLKEQKAPSHYNVLEKNAWSVRLCYTDTGLLEQDSAPYEHNMRYTGNDSGGRWKILNTRSPFHYALRIEKTDESGEPLPNVGFSVTNPVPPGENLIGQTGEDGTWTFEDSFEPNIAYELSEVSPPGGYHSLPANIQFKIEENITTDTYTPVLLNGDDLGENVSLRLEEYETADGTTGYVLIVTVQNHAGTELPSAGGPGTAPFVILGMLFICLPVIYGWNRRNNGERRYTR